MKIIFWILLLCIVSAEAQAQETIGCPEVVCGRKVDSQFQDEAMDAFGKWAQAEFDRRCLDKYPYLAEMCGGAPLNRIVVAFRVGKQGDARDVEVLQSFGRRAIGDCRLTAPDAKKTVFPEGEYCVKKNDVYVFPGFLG